MDNILNKIKIYFGNIGDAVSQLINVTFFLSSDANQSVSSRAYTNKNNAFWGFIQVNVDKVYNFFGVDDHCHKAYMNDISRASEYLRKHKDFK